MTSKVKIFTKVRCAGHNGLIVKTYEKGENKEIDAIFKQGFVYTLVNRGKEDQYELIIPVSNIDRIEVYFEGGKDEEDTDSTDSDS